MKVYVLSVGSEPDDEIFGVFSTLEAAEQRALETDCRTEIDVYEVDPLNGSSGHVGRIPRSYKDLMAAAPRLLAELRRLEWSGDFKGHAMCPSCGGTNRTHEPDCTLAAALAMVRPDPHL